jgi:hypothetical protein
LSSNGHRQVSIKGIDGVVEFSLERYKLGGDFFSFSDQFSSGYESFIVKDWLLHEIHHKSYHQVSEDLKTVTGHQHYSGNQICKKVKLYAQESTKNLIKQYAGLQLCIPFSDGIIDIYDAKAPEIQLFDDAIGVKKQKRIRESSYEKQQKTVQTDVIEIQKPTGDYEFITAGIGVKNWDIETALLCWMTVNYANCKLPIVAITDGAKSIRLRLWRIFGGQVVIILDWYHLNKKVRELMSMICFGKEQKQDYLNKMMPLLWEGKVVKVLEILATIKPRNSTKHQELIDYLTKHQVEIIDYKRRKQAGKTIGSGRAEKGVDLIVAQRQKNKPIAWSVDGSNSLSVLKATKMNQKSAA